MSSDSERHSTSTRHVRFAPAPAQLHRSGSAHRAALAATLAVLAALLLSACGAGGAQTSGQLSPSASQRVVNAEEAISTYCHTKRRDASISQAIAELISLELSHPAAHLSFAGTPGPFPSVRSTVQTEERQLAQCGGSAYAQSLTNALARRR